MTEKDKKNKIESMSIDELLNYEKASSIMIKILADNVRIHDNNDINNDDTRVKFNEYTRIHDTIINAIEKRLKELL